MAHTKTIPSWWPLLVGVLAACASPEQAPRTFAAEVPETTLTLNSTGACRIDEDCAGGLHCFQGACVWECDEQNACESGDTCSARRRCEAGAGGRPNAATPERMPGVQVTLPPPQVIRVEPGQSEVRLTVTTDVDVPGGLIGYTVETFAYATRTAAKPTRLFRAEGQRTFELVVPTGTADPNAENAGIEEVSLVTSLGTFRLRLQPQPSLSGRYAGTVAVSRFGAAGLPIELELITDPPNVDPARADHVYLVLPVRPGNIWSPVAPGPSSPTAVAAEAVFQAFSGTWVASFRTPFAFGSDSILARYDDEVVRGLRFEFAFDNGVVTGTVRDLWEGLYDTRTADGVESMATVVFEGPVTLNRVGKGRALEDLPALAPRDDRAVTLRPLPDLASQCAAGRFAVEPVTINAVSMSCDGIDNAESFQAASADAQAACAIAVAENALAAPGTTSKLILAFLEGENEGTESFAEFMARCAAGTSGTCQPSPEVLCGRALTAWSVATQLSPTSSFPALVDAYTRSTRETFLGRQLAAYQTDADTRLGWLKASDYPAIVTAQVRTHNEGLLNTWKEKVLNAHFSALTGQYDGVALAVLARQVQGDALVDARQGLLMEMSQSWRTAMESLIVA